MITYKKGDLLLTPDTNIVHGVNCQGVMGAGVAKQIRDKFPKVYSNYVNTCNMIKDKNNLLGQILVSQENDKCIFNCFIQNNYGRDKKIRYVSYDAIDKCMRKVYQQRNWFSSSIMKISMPKIGSGLGNGEWSIIEAIIKYRLSDCDVTIWEL